MKKILSLIIALSLIFGMFVIVPVSVGAGTYGDFQYTIVDGEVCIDCYINETATSVTVPSEIEDLPVTTIGYAAFGGFCPELASVTIPETVTRIEGGAFQDNEKLDDINILGELTYVGADVFKNTKFYNTAANWENGYLYFDTYLVDRSEEPEVTSVDIKSGTTLIAEEVFYSLDVPEITSITVPEGVKYICDRAFSFSTFLSISLPKSLLKLGKDCFDDCYYLESITVDSENENYLVEQGVLYNTAKTELLGFPKKSDITSVTIPSTITEIPKEFFNSASNLKTIVLPDTLTKIGNRAFNGTALYNDEANWGADGVLYINNCLIATNVDDYVIDEVTIKENTYIIADRAFEDCVDLIEIDIPNSVKYIGEFAVSYCEGLTTVTIGSGIKEIGEGAFFSCDALDTFNIVANADFVLEEGVLDSVKKVIIENGIIGENAFMGVNNLEQIEIGNGVTAIRDGAFISTELTEIVIPDSVLELGKDVFFASYNYSDESGLKKVTLGAGITAIPEGAFNACRALEEVVIKGEITNIGTTAFSICDKLKYVFLLMSEQEWNEIPVGDHNYDLQDAYIHFETLEHDYQNQVSKKASFTENGTAVNKCKYCEENKGQTTIHYVKTAKLSSTSVTYNGKLRTPDVILKDSQGEALEKDSDYTLNYESGRVNAGTYSVKVDLKGDYEGSKKLDFTIKPATAKTFKLSATSFEYNGKVRTPSVTVKDSNGTTLKKDVDYTVKYASGRKNVGKYSVKITMKGNYEGSKTLYFTINPPKRGLSKLTAGKKKLTATWKVQKSQTSGYQIQYSTSSKFKSYKEVTVSGYKSKKKTISKLKSKKVYYVRMRTYKTVSGKKYVSGWSSTKKVRVK